MVLEKTDVSGISMVFSTVKKGYIPEKSVFFPTPFLTLFDIHFSINPIRCTCMMTREVKLGVEGHVIHVKLGKVIHFNCEDLKVFFGEAEKLLYK